MRTKVEKTKIVKAVIYSLFAVGMILAMPSYASKKVALVIGNDHYQNVPGLNKAVNDASTISDVLRQRGFNVIQAHNLGRRATNQKIHQFISQVDSGDVAAFYYAGHGIEIEGQNYLLPVDVPAAESGQAGFVKSESISLVSLLNRLRSKHARLNIVVLDACRNNPFKSENQRGVGSTRGLAAVTPPKGTFILYSADAGEAALDSLSKDDTNPNSVFTRVLAPLILKPDVHLAMLARDVRKQVKRLARSVQHEQTPAYYDAVLGDFYFTEQKKPVEEPVVETIVVKKSRPEYANFDASLELAFWQDVKNSENLAFLDSYIQQYPNGKFVYLAKAKINALKPVAVSDKVALETFTGVKPVQNSFAPVKKGENQMALVRVDTAKMSSVNSAGSVLVPVEPARIPFENVSPQIDTCREHFVENRLTTGAGGNALKCYREILELKPTDPAALSGIRAIEDRYSSWAKSYIERGDENKAKGTIEKLRVVNPENPQLEELIVMLEARYVVTPKPEVQESEPNTSEEESSNLIAGLYTDNGDGTVTDTRTGLQWMRCSLGQTWNGVTCMGLAIRYALQTKEYNSRVSIAAKAARKSRIGEYSDWRVPTQTELLTLVYCSSGQPEEWNSSGKICEGKYLRPTISNKAFPATPALNYWTTTHDNSHAFNAWYVSFLYGYSHGLKRDGQLNVRLVRSAN